MKELIKKWWIWLIIVFIIFALVIFLIINKKEGMGTAGISKEEFNEINLGMTQFEVNSIIDKLNEWDDDEIYDKCCQEISSVEKDEIYTYVYKYQGENGGYAIITYEIDYSNGYYGLEYPKVVKKEVYNLK